MNKILVKKVFLILLTIIFTMPVYANDKLLLGLEVFNNKAQCGVCHTLRAANSNGKVGPDLDELKPQLKQIIYTVTNGAGVMQAYEGILAPKEILAVANYVFNSTNN